MKRELTYADKSLIGIRKVTKKKSKYQLQRTFERMMAKVERNRPGVERGTVYWG